MLITTATDIEVNSLQRSSTVIIQKSIREGFGLTVTEALWKGKPELAKEMGENGKEIVKEKFLITRLISDHLDILNDICNF